MKVLMSFAIIFAGAIIVSCTEGNTPQPYTYSQLISGKTSKTWKLDRVILRVEGKEDSQESLKACERDDLYTFYANDEKLFEVTNGLSYCDVKADEEPEENKLVSYTWSFKNANASLYMVTPHILGYYYIPFIVKSIDSNSMELEFYFNEEATVSYVLFFKKIEEK